MQVILAFLKKHIVLRWILYFILFFYLCLRCVWLISPGVFIHNDQNGVTINALADDNGGKLRLKINPGETEGVYLATSYGKTNPLLVSWRSDSEICDQGDLVEFEFSRIDFYANAQGKLMKKKINLSYLSRFLPGWIDLNIGEIRVATYRPDGKGHWCP